jgi:hypothetical protein
MAGFFRARLCFCLALAALTGTAAAASAAGDGLNVQAPAADSNLAQQLQNPVAALISVPLQNNVDFGFGPSNATRYTLNVQPVIPFSLNADFNLITRTIVPVISQGSPAPGTAGVTALGDITESLFLSPVAPFHGFIIGAGPAFLLPTATNSQIGTGKWGAGPTAVILRQQHGWTYGALMNQIWSFAGPPSHGPVNATFLQPFFGYTWANGFSLTSNTESTYDWTRRQWTVPVNLIASKVVVLGKQPLSFALGGRDYAVSPNGGADWGIRFVVTLLFPA